MDTEYFLTERYIKSKAKTIADLDTAMENLKSVDSTTRLKGAKRLNYHTSKTLGWTCLPVREWFWDDKNRSEFSVICRDESDEKVLVYLLAALRFIYERYLNHFQWEELYTEEDELKYKRWALSISEENQHISSEVKLRIAGIFAICGDSRAWDNYIEFLPRKSAYCGWARWDCLKYVKNSMTENQKADLIQVLDKITAKVKNGTVQYKVSQTKEILEGLEL